MSAPVVRGSASELTAAAPAFTDVNHEIQAAYKTLQEVGGRLGECWGHDETGQQFGDGYTTGVPTVDAVVTQLDTVLPAITSALTSAATRFAGTETATVDTLHSGEAGLTA